MQKSLFFLSIYLFIPSLCIAQINISGVVVEAKNNKPLSRVTLIIKPNNKWTVTDENGNFSLQVKKLPVTIGFSFLGKKKLTKTFKKATTNIKIVLVDDNLKIDEVVVTAKTKKESTGSNLVLGKQAINLVQAQSLADVMQLIPGKSISESNLHERQLLSLRTAFFNNSSKFNTSNGALNDKNEHLINNTFGVGYVIDGVPIDNDVNLIGQQSARYGIFKNSIENTSVGLGLDLKNLSLNNIESVEVVQGISSAKYGNHTTGLVKINRAYGVAPFTINTSLRGGSYNISVSKGLQLAKKYGFLNLGLEYLRSNQDPRNSLNKFDRVTSNISWMYRKPEKMRNRLSFSYAQNINSHNIEETEASIRKKKNDSKRIRFSNTNTLFFDNSFINRLQSTLSVDYSINETLNSTFTNNGGIPILGSFEEKTYEAPYTPAAYWGTELVENKPFSFFGRFEVQKTISLNDAIVKLDAGTSVSINKNFGRGNINDSNVLSYAARSNAEGKTGYRNINFSKLFPADTRFSAYTTANINTNLWGKKWVTDIGLRYDNYNKQSTLSPRINSALHFSKKVKARLGFGLFSKAPSLQALYPGNTYYDYLLADFRTNTYSLALAHTFVRKYQSRNLKPSRNLKYEAGIDVNIKKTNISLTGYYNKLLDGFTNARSFEIANLPIYNYTFYPNKSPDYTLSGYRPTLLDYLTPSNYLESENYGLELLINTKKIKSINTSFSLSAAYRYTKNTSNLATYVINNDISSNFLIGLHKGVPSEYEKINSSITAIHHISSIGLVITLTAEQFIMAKDSLFGKIAYPYAYYDNDFVYHEIPETDRTNEQYASIRRGETSNKTDNIQRMYGNYHLKLAKEFDNGFRFSFYAINFLNHLPRFRTLDSKNQWQYTQLNRPISFGGSILYKF